YNEMLNDPKKESTVVDITERSAEAVKHYGETMLVASPREYNEIMRKIPYGKIVTTDEIKRHLAKKHNTSCVCPLTCGIFVNICANAAAERNDKEFPYWRTVKAKGELCEKFPDGPDGHKELLETEGHTIIKKGKRYFVEDFDKKCIEL
ncbi:MAG: MGMT family protein, partial [Methanomassiliicoccaceae archaeon]|nr:MGMT family protein [Methanomassiliicoccaceae archaeon]